MSKNKNKSKKNKAEVKSFKVQELPPDLNYPMTWKFNLSKLNFKFKKKTGEIVVECVRPDGKKLKETLKNGTIIVLSEDGSCFDLSKMYSIFSESNTNLQDKAHTSAKDGSESNVPIVE